MKLNLQKIIVRLAILVLLVTTISPLSANAATISDVAKTDSRYAAIEWAVANGYLTTSNGKFNPSTKMTELELLKVLAKVDKEYTLKKDETSLYFFYGSESNLPLNGTATLDERTKVVTREHFARIYAATQGLDLTKNHAVQYLYVKEMFKNSEATLAAYKPSNALTKGDLAVFLKKMVELAKNNFVVKGLNDMPTGKDDKKITLPNGFLPSDGTIDIQNPGSGNTNDPSDHPNAFNPVQSITVEKQELIANGVDQTLVKIKLKDGYGNTIPNTKSLQFKLTSENGALFSTTGNGYSTSLSTIASDGGDLSFFVTAPMLTKSVIDTVRLELINNNERNYDAYKDKTIDVRLRYVPKAELRITYEIYDPDLPNGGGNVDPGIKPLPALPIGYMPNNQLITILDMDTDARLFKGEKVETYTELNGTTVTAPLVVENIQYENANLQFVRQDISVWLFEQLYAEFYENMGSFGVNYSIDDEGRATYNYPNYMELGFTNQFESESHAVFIYLMQFIPSNKNDITLLHYDSVKALKRIYDRFSVIDQNKLRQQFKNEVANLDAANAAVDSLKLSQLTIDRPANMERYTKVIVSLVAPGGQIITDFKGQVEIEFNGNRRTVGFTTNTTAFSPNTGHGGAAVAYFDDVLYGYSDVKARLVSMDDRYEDMLVSLTNTTATQKIFTNSKFEKNACDLAIETAFVVDQSMSMRKLDRTNFIASKTTELIAQLDADNTIAIRTSDNAFVQKKGDAKTVAASEGLFQYIPDETKATNLSAGIQAAISNFSDREATKKTIVVISDGKTSQSSLQNVLKQAKVKGIEIYTITVGKATDVNLTTMKRIATETGGLHFHVTDVNLLHDTYQVLIDTILCEDEYVNASCDNIYTMFEEAKVSIGRSFFSMNGLINSSCSNVAEVKVHFVAEGAEFTFPLIARGNNVFRSSQSISKLSQFNLYTTVEFVAYDQQGKIVGLKQINIQ